ncbi:MAG: LysM peptidoglycan-binding domain-containing protein [Thermoleophilaceae bacterium]|nr:LysM peptidoglycan-binding domain-containing protein [Thermoleophilaceae bacterium]
MSEQAGKQPNRRPPRPAAGKTTTSSAGRLLVLAAIGLALFAVFVTVASSGSSNSSSKSSSDVSKSSEKSSGSGAADSSTGSSSPDVSATAPLKATYRVRPGDSFGSIAEDQGISVETLQELNPDIDPRALQPGQKLKLK